MLMQLMQCGRELRRHCQVSCARSLEHTIAHVLLYSNYQDGQSEQYIGEWMQKRQNRDEMVIATSMSLSFVQTQI